MDKIIENFKICQKCLSGIIHEWIFHKITELMMDLDWWKSKQFHWTCKSAYRTEKIQRTTKKVNNRGLILEFCQFRNHQICILLCMCMYYWILKKFMYACKTCFFYPNFKSKHNLNLDLEIWAMKIRLFGSNVDFHAISYFKLYFGDTIADLLCPVP